MSAGTFGKPQCKFALAFAAALVAVLLSAPTAAWADDWAGGLLGEGEPALASPQAEGLSVQGEGAQEELSDFLYAYASLGNGVLEYDSADPGVVGSDGKDILDKMMGNAPLVCVDYSIYPVAQPSFTDESMEPGTGDSRAAYVRYEAESVEWVARNIFNVGDSYIATRRAEGGTGTNGRKWFYRDGAYYAGVFFGGGPAQYAVDVVSCVQNAGGTYDVAYDLVTTDYSPGAKSTVTTTQRRYAEMKLVTQDGERYWSLLRHSASPMPSSQAGGAQAMYRLYNPNSGEHFYTADAGERGDVIRAGWDYEGVGWVRPGSGADVFRLYNPYAGEHHYTLDADERDELVAAGWVDEGVGWASSGAGGVPVYREYNPNAFSCNHNYTTDKAEHDSLVGLGWVDEGIAWRGSSEELPRANPMAADGSGGKKVTLTGVVVRKNETTADTMMAWGCASYFLVLPEPVDVTYSSFADGPTVARGCTQIHIASTEFYTATEDPDQVWLADHPWEAATDFDANVGYEATVTGNLVNMNNAHVRGICKFGDYTIAVHE